MTASQAKAWRCVCGGASNSPHAAGNRKKETFSLSLSLSLASGRRLLLSLRACRSFFEGRPFFSPVHSGRHRREMSSERV